MKEQSSSGNNDSRLQASRMIMKNKSVSKLSMYETNMQNFTKNQKFTLEKIDPKGITASGVYGSFSGAIEDTELFSNCDETLQISYKIYYGEEWHDETPQTDDTEGESQFCQSKNGKIAFSLGFDFLISSMYIITWPQIVITVKGFNAWGQLVTKGYAQLFLPTQTGQQVRQAYIYSIVRNQKWYHRWIPFIEPDIVSFDGRELQRLIVKGEGRQSQKIKTIGVINVRMETLLRNFNRFGYK